MTEIRELDRNDEGQMHDWWSCGHDAMSTRPVDLWPDWEISRHALPQVDEERRTVFLGAYEDGAMVGGGLVLIPTTDNTHIGSIEVLVPPRHRRRGFGTALLEHAERIITAAGRTTLLADVRAPLDDGDNGEDGRWAMARGYAVANVDGIKAVDLGATADRLPELEARAAERLGDYRLLWWSDPAPDEHLASSGGRHEPVPGGDPARRPRPPTRGVDTGAAAGPRGQAGRAAPRPDHRGSRWRPPVRWSATPT